MYKRPISPITEEEAIEGEKVGLSILTHFRYLIKEKTNAINSIITSTINLPDKNSRPIRSISLIWNKSNQEKKVSWYFNFKKLLKNRNVTVITDKSEPKPRPSNPQKHISINPKKYRFRIWTEFEKKLIVASSRPI